MNINTEIKKNTLLEKEKELPKFETESLTLSLPTSVSMNGNFDGIKRGSISEEMTLMNNNLPDSKSNLNISFSDSIIPIINATVDLPDEIPNLQLQSSESFDNLICSADTGDYNWINPDLFGEEFATLDIFDEAENSSLLSAVLPLNNSNMEVIWE